MSDYNMDLSVEVVAQLAIYYELLLRWNERLHLVSPCSPEEFAARHVLESLTLLNHLPEQATVIDIGSGAGLPIVPCLIARNDISATLIEASQKKSVFLREALKTADALNRATIVAKRFEDLSPPNAQFISCRALDDFSTQLSTLVRWALPGTTLLLFGSENLRQTLTDLHCDPQQFLLPGSDRRFLFKADL